MANYNILVATSSRAEYGILRKLIFDLKKTCHKVQILATGTHLSKAYGYTLDEIIQDGLEIEYKIASISKNKKISTTIDSMTIILSDMEKLLSKTLFDFVILLGDRFEIFSIATACLVNNVPIVHLHGGEVTIGAIDEQFRHSISKMSSLHFPIHEQYKSRLISMGEHPSTVFNYGSLAIEQLMEYKLRSLEELEKDNIVPFTLTEPYIVMTYHPETHGAHDYKKYLTIIIDAIKSWNINCIITKANADKYGYEINLIINKLTSQNNRFKLVDSLGIINYLSIVKHSNLVVGNSSSAIIEIPSLKVPVINIGDRQKGRIRHPNIIDVDYSFDEINNAYSLSNTEEFKNKIRNLRSEFEGNDTSNKMIRTIESFFALNKDFTKKGFYNEDEDINDNE